MVRSDDGREKRGVCRGRREKDGMAHAQDGEPQLVFEPHHKRAWRETLERDLKVEVLRGTPGLSWWEYAVGMLQLLYFRWSVATAIFMLYPREVVVVNSIYLCVLLASLYALGRSIAAYFAARTFAAG
ncbi:hypothetical protein FVE85_9517 [Porphyridium purpureum]|uniref:Uncharacterized protein n=1 Tax=Porphyridium purpureum TaxID=35688 RepID=A0A5J4YJJ1_PORPP|nr:hypothetical protein FVE85_9517 [Porphyridium purpureum]|eukprot:POR5745..scf261_15